MVPNDRSVRFSGIGFDPDTGEVTRDGTTGVRLQEQPARVLERLTSRAGQLVTRDELHRLLWPENSLVDADNGLNIAINKIRLALDDSAGQPRFIQTVPRRGYRFIGTLEPSNPAVAPPPRSSRSTKAIWTGVSVFGLLIVSLVVFTSWRARSPMPTLAVLPFTNLTGNVALDYAVQGLTDTLTTELAASGQPRVIAPEAAAYYRNPPVTRAARDLHADELVVGTVVQDGASFAVNVRLVNGSTERTVWAKRFVRATAIELTFSEDITSALSGALGLARAGRLSTGPSARVPVAARDEYLRGRHFWNKRISEAYEPALEHLTRAIEIDRNYALAWAGLADIYGIGVTTPSRVFVPWPGEVEAGIRAAEEALRLDPSLGEAHASLGKLRMLQWRWQDAEREFSEAVRLSPNYAPARQWYGTLLARFQKCPAAMDQTAVGAEIDPVTPIVNEAVGVALGVCGHSDRAVAVFKRVLALHPDFPSTHMRLAGAYLRLGDATAALEEYREARRLRPENCEIQARMVSALIAAGDRPAAQELANHVVAVAKRDGRLSCAAVAHANLGEIDRAFAALNAIVVDHGVVDGWLIDHHLRPLHADQRWVALLDKVGLTPYAQAAPDAR